MSYRNLGIYIPYGFLSAVGGVEAGMMTIRVPLLGRLVWLYGLYYVGRYSFFKSLAKTINFHPSEFRLAHRAFRVLCNVTRYGIAFSDLFDPCVQF
jgi:hypothetical protein